MIRGVEAAIARVKQLQRRMKIEGLDRAVPGDMVIRWATVDLQEVVDALALPAPNADDHREDV